MDFFQFLQKSSDSHVTNKKSNKKNIVKTDNKQLDNKQLDNKQLDNKHLDNQQLDNQQLVNQETTIYKNIKRGDFVKIIYLKNSSLNIYKGYVGDIREYRKDQDSAIIFLHAISSNNAIRFPIEHFVKID
jgi:hypothetical protein